MPQPLPQPRIDAFVRHPETGAQVRQTEYSGTVWYGQPPDVSGRVVGFVTSAVRDDTPFFLPDSLPYKRSDLEGGVVACTASIQAQNGETTFVTEAQAGWADDPRGGDTCWIQVRLVVYGRQPLAVSYRVVASCAALAVPSPRVVDMRGVFDG